jgi:DnaJ-class molecular chaperone
MGLDSGCWALVVITPCFERISVVTSKKKVTCPSCGGSGQIQFFQGESRFLLTVEEGPECCGTGYIVNPDKRSGLENRKESTDQKE